MAAWWLKALCRESGVDDELWFGRRNRVDHEAIAMCRKCPVQMECLADALHDEQQASNKQLIFGIRGGLIASQRARLLAAWQRHKPATASATTVSAART